MNLRQIRLATGISFRQFASILRLQPDTLCRLEAGEYDGCPEIEAEIQRRLRRLGFCTVQEVGEPERPLVTGPRPLEL